MLSTAHSFRLNLEQGNTALLAAAPRKKAGFMSMSLESVT